MKKIVEDAIDAFVVRYPMLSSVRESITECISCLKNTYENGRKLLICGNGGSAADSLHIVGELMKSFSLKRDLPSEVQEALRNEFPDEAERYIQNLQCPLPAMSLVNEVSLITAYGNDVNAEFCFAQQVLGYGKKGDALLVISTSGNSPNVIHAARVAKAMGLTVISMTGRTGGILKSVSDVLINVPADITHQVQELHLPIYHLLCQGLELEFFEEK